MSAATSTQREREARQVRDEAPAYRYAEGSGKERVETLASLVAKAIATGEDGSAESLAIGALISLADELEILYEACTVEGEIVNYAFPIERVPTVLWRLSERAHAAVAIYLRMAEVERNDVASASEPAAPAASVATSRKRTTTKRKAA